MNVDSSNQWLEILHSLCTSENSTVKELVVQPGQGTGYLDVSAFAITAIYAVAALAHLTKLDLRLGPEGWDKLPTVEAASISKAVARTLSAAVNLESLWIGRR